MSKERPKRNIIQKKYDDSDGIPWSEERVVLLRCPTAWCILEALRMRRKSRRKMMRQKTSKQPPTMLHLHASRPPGKEKPTNMFTTGMFSMVPAGQHGRRNLFKNTKAKRPLPQRRSTAITGLTAAGSRLQLTTPQRPPPRVPRPRGLLPPITTPLCIGRLRTYGNRFLR